MSMWVAALWVYLYLGEWQGSVLALMTTANIYVTCSSQHVTSTAHWSHRHSPIVLEVSEADIYKSVRRVRDSWWHSPFSGPQSCWTSFHQRRRFWTSCRRPCSWWWAGGRRSAVVPSSQLMPSGWVAGSSYPLGHYCRLKLKKKNKKKTPRD